ncbi:hypothetical protein OUZ56_010125 [Daphnia magna]|uniref:Uncharacterized protein n=1 Tax=Daphnia magna TaxID=35525 RepID=A0ABR0AI99_9CRUS|nr:hypothetical protein OUZ56_010125 [Daphnia magna]
MQQKKNGQVTSGLGLLACCAHVEAVQNLAVRSERDPIGRITAKELSIADGGRQRRCPAKIFCLDRAHSKELIGWMSSLLKSTEARKLIAGSFHESSIKVTQGRRGFESGDKGEDIAKPSIQAVGRVQASSLLVGPAFIFVVVMADAAVLALKLWGHSFHTVTMHRRENILKQTDTRFQSLLFEPNRLNPKECGSLFGRSSLKQMVKEVSDDQKVKSLGGS